VLAVYSKRTVQLAVQVAEAVVSLVMVAQELLVKGMLVEQVCTTTVEAVAAQVVQVATETSTQTRQAGRVESD
jgi:hypothetical protein